MANSGLQFPPPYSVLQLEYASGVYQQSILGPPPLPSPVVRLQRPRPRARHEIWNSPYAPYLLDTPAQGQPYVPYNQTGPSRNGRLQHVKRIPQQRSREQEFSKHRRLKRGHEKIDPLLWKPAVPKMDTPDQIEKWRQDRRKNYPTAENVRQKIGREMKRHTMGAIATVMDLKGGKRNKQWNRRRHCPFPNNASVTWHVSDHESRDGMVSTKQVSVCAATSQKCTASALQALAGYGDNSDSDGVMSDSFKQTKESSVGDAVTTDRVEKDDWQDVQQTTRTQKRNHSFGRAKNSNARKRSCNSDSKQDISEFRPLQPTLLQKLLAGEIQRERNILLQCIRYIVQNDFFRT